MNFVAGMLLLFVPEEEAFWMVTTVINELLPANYYSSSLHGVKVLERGMLREGWEGFWVTFSRCWRRRVLMVLG